MSSQENKLPGYRWVVVAVVCLLCFMANYMQYQVSALATLVMPEMGIDTAGFSMLFLAPMLIAVFLSIPLGAAGDKIGPKKVVAIFSIISVGGAFLRCFTLDSFMMQFISMFLLGCGISALNANLVKILGVWFHEKIQTAMGMFYASSCVAIVVAQICAPMFGTVFNSYIWAAILQLVATILWIVLARDIPVGETMPPPEPVMQYLKVAAKSGGTWLIAFGVGLGLATTTAYAGLLPQALELGKGIDMGTSGVMAAAVTAASFFGVLFGPMIADRMGKIKGYLIITTLIGGIVMFATWYTPVGPVLWVVLLLNGFFTAINGPIMQSLPYLLPEIREKYAGSAGGLVGTVSTLVSFFLPTIIASVAGESYALNFAIESVCFTLAIVIIAILPELGPKGKVAQGIAAREEKGLGPDEYIEQRKLEKAGKSAGQTL